MARKKTYTAKIKNTGRMILIGLLALFLVLFFIQFDVVAEPVAKVLNVPVSRVKTFGRTWAVVALSFVLIIAGVFFVGIPVVGALLAIAGVAMASLAIYNWMTENDILGAG